MISDLGALILGIAIGLIGLKLTERNERENEILSAVDAAIPSRIVQWIRHRAAVAEQQQVFGILIGLSAYTQCGQVDVLLELGRNFQILQQRDGVFGHLESAQRFRLFHQRVDDGKLADTRNRTLRSKQKQNVKTKRLSFVSDPNGRIKTLSVS